MSITPRAWGVCGSAALVFLAALVTLPSSAAPAAPNGVFEPAPVPPTPVLTWTRWLQIGVQADLATQPDPDLKQIYGRQSPFGLRLQANVLFEERYGIGLSAGLQRRAGTGVAPDGEPPETVLWQVPVAVEGWLRMALWRDQPVVPYLRAGFDVVVGIERVLVATPAAEEDATDDEANSDPPEDLVAPWVGVKAGVHGGGGVQIRLPFPELQWEGGMTGPPGLSDIYFHIEGWGRSADNFGADGVNLSAVGVSAGLTLIL
jgi:hypothetical protein